MPPQLSNLNILFLFSDEHRRDAMGCAGHRIVQTPHLDRLAESGTRFNQAYTPSPICVPARASLACGEYVNKTRCWSNAQAYKGNPVSWGHQLIQNGNRVDAIGKLHYRGPEFNNGFNNEILPMYIRGGKGWIKGLLRNHESVLDCSAYSKEIGPGSNGYTDYDLGVTKQACRWLSDRKNTNTDKPWALFVSWLRPHYPLTCPEAFYNLYPLQKMDSAKCIENSQLPTHPVLNTLKKNFNYDDYFNDDTRQIARASYYGLCSFLDHQVGQVLHALKQSGQADRTVIIYSSDHGDHNGDRGMWTKMTLYDESSGIPLILAGPDIPKGEVVSTLTSLVDIYPTILQSMGVPDDRDDHNTRPGISLRQLANEKKFDRPILSEYHDGGSPTGMFMLRNDRWKYNYYPGYTPEMYDMVKDPNEIVDLGQSEQHKDARILCHKQMLNIVNPNQANELAFSDQASRIEELGGVAAILRSEEYDHTPVGS